jgi:hypothetical protein
MLSVLESPGHLAWNFKFYKASFISDGIVYNASLIKIVDSEMGQRGKWVLLERKVYFNLE